MLFFEYKISCKVFNKTGNLKNHAEVEKNYHFKITVMNTTCHKVFFKVESTDHDSAELKQFGQQCINQISKSAKIVHVNQQNHVVSFTVAFHNYSDAEELIHQCCYKHYSNGIRALALWNGTKPNFEVYVSNGPKGMMRRDLFLAMERFGAIGKVTISNSVEGAGWVSFLYQNSYKTALAASVYLNGKKLKVSMIEEKIDSIPPETQKKAINFLSIINEDTKHENMIRPTSFISLRVM